ncbi:MAG: hypothetical protein WCP92_08560 [bacterium]
MLVENLFFKFFVMKPEQETPRIPYDIYESPQEIVILLPLG